MTWCYTERIKTYRNSVVYAVQGTKTLQISKHIGIYSDDLQSGLRCHFKARENGFDSCIAVVLNETTRSATTT